MLAIHQKHSYKRSLLTHPCRLIITLLLATNSITSIYHHLPLFTIITYLFKAPFETMLPTGHLRPANVTSFY